MYHIGSFFYNTPQRNRCPTEEPNPAPLSAFLAWTFSPDASPHKKQRMHSQKSIDDGNRNFVYDAAKISQKLESMHTYRAQLKLGCVKSFVVTSQLTARRRRDSRLPRRRRRCRRRHLNQNVCRRRRPLVRLPPPAPDRRQRHAISGRLMKLRAHNEHDLRAPASSADDELSNPS